MQGTATLLDWMAHGAQKVSPDEAKARARICVQQCHFNQPVAGCTNCSRGKLRDLAVQIVGEQPVIRGLEICTICGCALDALVWIPKDVIQRHMTQEQQDRSPKFCWKL